MWRRGRARISGSLPAQLLPVWPKTQEQLRELNIRIIREVAAMQPEHLALAFGRFGFVLHQRALGIDDTPVYPPRACRPWKRMPYCPRTAMIGSVEKHALWAVCARRERLRAQKQRAGRMEVRVRYSDYREAAARRNLPRRCNRRRGCQRRRAAARTDHGRRTRVRSLHLSLPA